MINDFIQHLKSIDVFEGRIGNFNTWSTEILFNDHYFQIEFDFTTNKVEVSVWVEVDEDFIQVELEKKEMFKLINFLETLEPEQEESPITDYYKYYGVQQSNFL